MGERREASGQEVQPSRRVVVIAPVGQDGVAIASVLQKAGIEASTCPDLRSALPEIKNSGVLLLTEEALELPGLPDILETLRTQPSWSELPVIILTSGGESRLVKLLDMTFDAAGSVTLFERPIGTTTLLRAVQAALRSRERQYRVRDLLIQQRKSQTIVSRNAERQRILAAALAHLFSAEEPDQIVRELFPNLMTSLGLDAYFHYTLNEKGDGLELASFGGVSEEMVRSNIALGDGICGRAAQCRQPVILSGDCDPGVGAMIRASGIRSYVCYPLMSDTRLLGTVSYASRNRERFDDDELQFMEMISGYIAVAMERILTRQALLESETRLKTTLAREKQLRQSAEEANRLKDEFLATMSHELRNPLNVIVGYSDLLLRNEKIKASPQLLRMSAALRRNALAQSHLIRDLLEFSRLRSGKVTLNRETVSLMTTISNAIETVRPDAAPKHISIEVEAAEEPYMLDGDLLRLEQIFWNLLSNSIKFTPAGGRVTIRLDRQDNEIVTVVEDTGQGIEPAFLPHVFEMFRQGDSASNRPHAGMGIGLALVQQLVNLHNGTVTAESEGTGKGTRFTVRLPAQSHNGETPREIVNEEAQTLTGRTILAVDDHEDTANMIQMQLEAKGATVFAATSGREALKFAREHHLDAIVTDISMPEMDGFDLLRQLRRLPGKEHVPIVAVTGLGQPEDVRRALREGFQGHLTKPLEISALVDLVRRLW